MKHKLSAALICLISFIAIYFAVQLFAEHQKKEQIPVAVNGVLDLSHYDFNKQGPVALNGEWSYCDGQFLTVHNFLKANEDQQVSTVDVPSKIAGFGYGSYHLRILLKHADQIDYGIKTTNIGLSNALFVNGVKVGISGIPAQNKGSYQPKNVPYVTVFTIEKDVVDLVLWTANFDYAPYGGIVAPLYFGSSQQIVASDEISKLSDAVVIASLLIIALVYLCIYAFRRTSTPLKYFGIYALMSSLFIITHGEKLFYLIIPELDYRVFAKLQFLSAGFYIIFYLLYLNAYYPNLFIGRTYKVLMTISAVFIPIGFLAPLSIQSQFSGSQMAFILIVLLYSVYKMVFGVLNQVEFALYTALGALVTLFMVLVSIENIVNGAQFEFAFLYAQTIFILIHALFNASRLGKSFEDVLKLSNELMIQDKRKNEFLAKTSHEFKTPLHGIMNIIGLYIEKEKDFMHEEDLDNMRLVIDMSKRLSRLVNDILDMDLMKEGKLRLEKTFFPLEQCLLDMVSVCKRLHEDRPIVIEIISEGEIPVIYQDRDRLIQIMYNLLDNAMNHTQASFVKLIVKSEGQTLILSVTDNGVGIEKDQLIKIFDLYEHFSDVKTSNRGIGLSIVKQLVEYIGGTITVNSTVGSGTTFTLTFDCVQSHAKVIGERLQGVSDSRLESGQLESDQEELLFESMHLELATPLVINQNSDITVLVVDDSFSNLKIMIDALKPEKYNIIAVKNGHEMLDVFLNYSNIDLIVLDLLLPDYSGYELCRLVRERRSVVELPILILTAAVNPDDLQYALSLGANDFIHKPYPVNELRARVDSLLKVKEVATRSAKYEVAFLHAQIKPHFLYNALTAIASSCKADSREARDLILSLAKYLRGTLDFENLGNLVTLEKELTLVKAYVAIEKARFPNLEFEIQMEEDMDIQLPPMTLQVLVENAVKHGAVKHETKGFVKVTIQRSNNGVQFVVEDNGNGIELEKLETLLDEPKTKESIGLYNVNTRLVRYFGTGLWFENKQSGGLKVSFEIVGRM